MRVEGLGKFLAQYLYDNLDNLREGREDLNNCSSIEEYREVVWEMLNELGWDNSGNISSLLRDIIYEIENSMDIVGEMLPYFMFYLSNPAVRKEELSRQVSPV